MHRPDTLTVSVTMSALLVGYGSSDEEGVEEDVGVERPAKVGGCYTRKR